jgi:hypothetical protein
MPKHREYPIALKRTAVARVAAGESIAAVALELNRGTGFGMRGETRVRRGGPEALRGRGRPRKGVLPVTAAAATARAPCDWWRSPAIFRGGDTAESWASWSKIMRDAWA